MEQGRTCVVQSQVEFRVVQWKRAMSHAKPSKPRTLKVHDIGDYYRKEVVPQIRLQGKWLLNAGVKPGKSVHITNPQPGVLIVKCLE